MYFVSLPLTPFWGQIPSMCPPYDPKKNKANTKKEIIQFLVQNLMYQCNFGKICIIIQSTVS